MSDLLPRHRWLAPAAGCGAIAALALLAAPGYAPVGAIATAFAMALVCCVAASARREQRLAWALLGASQVLWATGDLIYVVASTPAGTPAAADAVWLCGELAAYASMALLVRAMLGVRSLALWLDAATACFGAVAALLVLLHPLSHLEGTGLQRAITIAYPLLGLAQMALVATGATVSAGRREAWWLLGVGFGLSTAGDAATLSGPLDNSWDIYALAYAAFAVAALMPAPARRSAHREWRSILPGFAWSLGALTILTVGGVRGCGVALALVCGLTLLSGTARAGMLVAANHELIVATHEAARTDWLTGLPNRQALLERLEELSERATPAVLVLADLDGFKRWNDTLGHAAGDELLQQLGRRLTASLPPSARGYRLGGDEFCVVSTDQAAEAELRAGVERMLSEDRDGLRIGCSLGAVTIPSEAGTSREALALADQRMYAEKARRGGRRRTDGLRRSA